MGYKPLMSGEPTIEISQRRYEELIRGELQAIQYREYIKEEHPEEAPEIVKVIEGIECEMED